MTASSDSGTTKIIGRTRRLLSKQQVIFDQIFDCYEGGVLDFNIITMAEWFEENFDINIFADTYLDYSGGNDDHLRGFVENAEPRLVAKVLRTLWDYRCSLDGYVEQDKAEEERLNKWLDQFTMELENASTLNPDVFKEIPEDATILKLRASIIADLYAGKPEVVLVPLHTYCVKRLRYLLKSRKQPVDEKMPLHKIFTIYSKALRAENQVDEFAMPLLSVQHKTFEGLNKARNKRSEAHDNKLLDNSEAQFIVECVLASLAFIERLEEKRQAPSANLDDEIPW